MTIRKPEPIASDVTELVRHLGSLLDDVERARIANGNRIGALQRAHGDAFPELLVSHQSLDAMEHQVILQLQRAWRKHPLAPWAKSIPGAGEKLVARLVAIIGDPCVRSIGHWEDDPRHWVIDSYERRTVGQLWTYCGHGDAGRRRRAGMTQEELFKAGNPDAKKRVFLLATQFVKTSHSPYRTVYEEARERYAERIHERECPACHAKAGDLWKPGHQHAAALRLTGKTFLKDMWREMSMVRGELALGS